MRVVQIQKEGAVLLCEPVAKPDHVPNELVRNFDNYNIPGADTDVQAAYADVQRTFPPIFWTPLNGGHWVATRAEDIQIMQRDHTRFSYRRISVPPFPDEVPPFVPLELDPPIHAKYRRPLMQALTPRVVSQLEDAVQKVAVDTVEALVPLGGCEFIGSFAKILPIYVFLDLVELPRADKDQLLQIAEKSVRPRSFEERMAAQLEMATYLSGYLQARREAPGSDLLSQIVTLEIDGQRISEQEATIYASLVMFGGLDTVAGMIGFFAKFLAEHPADRRRVVERLDDESFLTRVIEELIRRHGLANTARVITQDFDYKGIAFREGDRILPPNLLVGLDENLNEDPLTVNFDRVKPVHAAFGNGPHACPGAVLARRELRVFLKEWLSRIPNFRIRPGSKPVLVTGQVIGMPELQLVWP